MKEIELAKSGRTVRSWFSAGTAGSFIIFLAILVGAFVLPAYSDDQWVLESAEEVRSLSVIPNLYAPLERWLPLGGGYYWLLGSLSLAGLNFFELRLVFGMFAFLAWMALGRAFPRNSSSPTLIAILPASIFLTSTLSWMITVRPEPLVALLGAVLILSYRKYLDRRQDWIFVAGLLVAGLAISTHQTGLIVLFPAILFAARYTMDKYSRRDFLRLLLSFSTVVLGSSLAMFWFYDLQTLYSLTTSWREFSTHASGPLDEPSRWLRVLDSDWAMRRVTGAVLLSAWLGQIVNLWLSSRSTNHGMYVFLALFPVGLIFTSSKWEWHVAAIIPSTISFFLLLDSELGREKANFRAVASILSVGAGTLLLLWLSDPSLGMQPLFVRTLWFGSLALAVIVFLAFFSLGKATLIGATSIPLTVFLIMTLANQSAVFVEEKSLRNGFLETKPGPISENPQAKVQSRFLSTSVFQAVEPVNVEMSDKLRQIGEISCAGIQAPMPHPPSQRQGEILVGFWFLTKARNPTFSLVDSNGKKISPLFLGSDSNAQLNLGVNLWQLAMFSVNSLGPLRVDIEEPENETESKILVSRAFRFSTQLLATVYEEGGAYGGVYEATKYQGVDLLQSGRGIWPEANLVFSDRSLYQFAAPLQNDDLCQIFSGEDAGLSIYQRRILVPDALVLRTEGDAH